MTSKSRKVYNHFNCVEKYLHQQFDIQVRADIVKELIGRPVQADIVDLGCGDGSISLQFQADAKSISLVDISENMLNRARMKIQPAFVKRINFYQKEVACFQSDKKYDVVLGIGLLAHVDSVSGTISKMSDILKPGGFCVVQITDQSKLYAKFLTQYNRILDKLTGQFGYSRNRLTSHGIVDIAATCGLRYVTHRQYSLTPPGFTSMVPDEMLYRYHRFVHENKLLSQFGSDSILMFRKA